MIFEATRPDLRGWLPVLFEFIMEFYLNLLWNLFTLTTLTTRLYGRVFLFCLLSLFCWFFGFGCKRFAFFFFVGYYKAVGRLVIEEKSLLIKV